MKKRILSFALVFVLAFTLVACKDSFKDEVEAALEVAGGFPGTVETVGIQRDQNFPTTLRDYPEVKITWSSDKPQYLANDGKVTRPEAGKSDELVTVTITASREKAKASKTVKFLVLAELQTAEVTIASLYDSKTPKNDENTKWDYEYLGKYIELNDLTVAAKYRNENAFYLTDGERLLMVYQPTLAKEVKVGEVYNVKGVFGHNYGSAQLADEKDGQPVSLELVENGVAKEMPTTKETVSADFINTEVYNGENLFEPTAYELTGKVMIDDSDASPDYHLFLVEPTYTGRKIVKTVSGDKAVEFLAPTVNVYYQGLTAPLKEYNGRTVTFTYLPVGLRTDRGQLNYGVFVNEDSLVVKDATPEEQFNIHVNNLYGKYDGKSYSEAITKLDFESKIGSGDIEATITWESKDLTKIDAEGNFLVRPKFDEEPVKVKVEATIKMGTFEEVAEFEVTIAPELKLNTVEEVLTTGEKGDTFKIKGLLNMFQPQNFALVDATGGISLRDNPKLLEGKDLNKVYIIIGTYDEFRDNPQLAITVIIETDETIDGYEQVLVNDDSTFTELQGLLLKTGQVKVTNVEVDNNKNTKVTFSLGDTTFTIQTDERIEKFFDATQLAAFKALKVDDLVTMTGFTYINGGFYFTTATKVVK